MGDRLEPETPLRVVVYTDSAGIGGAEISLGHLVAHVAESIELTIVGVSAPVLQAIGAQRPRAPQIVLPPQGPSALIAHWQTFNRLRPHLIHCNLCTPWAGAIGLAAALMTPQARVVRVDQLPLRTTDALTLWRTRLLCLRVDAHVAVGQASAQRMEDFYALGRGSVRSIPNGVPDRRFDPTTSLPPLPRASLVVGSIGRLDAMKAHELLIRAIAPLDGVNLVILGEGEQRSALETLAEDLGVGDRVKLLGWVEQPHRYLSNFDVMALPSRSEGFPLAMVEAMLAAKPVVATQVGSMPEAIIHQETGLLIEKNNVEQLSHAIRQLRDHPELRVRLGEQARQRAIAHYTAKSMAQQYAQLWRQVGNAPPAPRLRVPRPKD